MVTDRARPDVTLNRQTDPENCNLNTATGILSKIARLTRETELSLACLIGPSLMLAGCSGKVQVPIVGEPALASADSKPETTGSDTRGWVNTALFALLIAGAGFYLFRRRQGGFDYSEAIQSPAEQFAGDRLTIADIGGSPDLVARFKQLAREISLVRSGEYGLALPKGILLSGPPGVGKTFSCRALAGTAECPVLIADGSSLGTEVFVGTGVAKLRRTWAGARRLRDRRTKQLRKMPGATGYESEVILLVIDEFDSLGHRRAASTHGSGIEDNRNINYLLSEFDHVDSRRNQNIIVIGVTNRPELLDPALLRPGRFTEKIELLPPRTAAEREDILKKLWHRRMWFNGYTLQEPSLLKEFAAWAVGATGDDLQATLRSLERDVLGPEERRVARREDLLEAFQRVKIGSPSTLAVSDSERRKVATHEHGHALAAEAVGTKAFLLSMRPRGTSLGRILHETDTDEQLTSSLRGLLNRLLVGAGGRAAEHFRFGPLAISDGAVSDLDLMRQVATHIVRSGMVEGLYAGPVDSEQNELTVRERSICNRLMRVSFEAARSLVEAIGTEVMDILVSDSLALERDLVGAEVTQFIESRLPASARETLVRIVGDYHKRALNLLGHDS